MKINWKLNGESTIVIMLPLISEGLIKVAYPFENEAGRQLRTIYTHSQTINNEKPVSWSSFRMKTALFYPNKGGFFTSSPQYLWISCTNMMIIDSRPFWSPFQKLNDHAYVTLWSCFLTLVDHLFVLNMIIVPYWRLNIAY